MAPIDMTSSVLQEKRGAGLWLRLNRPDSLNGLHPDLLAGLHAGLDRAEVDEDIRVVVIAANGKAFCAGADLVYANSLQSAPRPHGRRDAAQLFLQDVRELLQRIEHLDLPVIAAVQGVTVGGGLELAMCCDFIIAARSARIGDGHANFGQIPGGGATVRLPQRVGVSLAKRLMFTGVLLPASELELTDLLSEVVDDDELESAVQSLIDTISSKSPVGIARMKMLIQDSLDVPVHIGLTIELEESALHQTSADWREGIAAFNEKRRPNFTGS